jgi:ABC-type nitrate/sulfonate/bicarbonate transport system ATPase subunit
MQQKIGTVTVSNLHKKYVAKGKEISVLEDINLNVSPGEFVSVIGQSGCGKTTLLRLLASLESDFSGEILVDGKKINGPSLNRGVVFQDHRLLPWLTVEKNVGLGLKKLNGADKKKIVQEHIDLVGLNGFEQSYPAQLSGGMSQRAAIARALINRPEILFLDEPLGALDALTRMYMHKEIERIWEKEAITMIMVTHDVEEALYLSDKIVIMSARPGTIKKILPVNLPRPRDRASYDFLQLKDEVLREFHLDTEKLFSYAI